MRCPKCHFGNPSDSSFCSKCGTRIVPFSREIPISQTETLKTAIQESSTGSIFADLHQIIDELGRAGMGSVHFF